MFLFVLVCLISFTINTMHGKAQREPARHSVVLDCKLVPLHNMCQSLLAACLLYTVHAVRLAVCPNAKI